MKNKSIFIVVMFFVVCFLTPFVLAVAPNFQGLGSEAWGVSVDGSVVVGQTNNNGAFRWTESEGMITIGSAGGGLAFGVSADGSVVVGSNSSGDAFRWTESEGMITIGSAGGSYAFGVSADGSVVVGINSSGDAFRWTESEGMVTIGDGAAFGVSADGSVVVGQTNNNGAFRWTESEGMVTIGDGQAFGVSADGSVVVGSNSSGDAFRWTESEGMVTIGDGSAWGVSADGSVVVGWSTDIANDPNIAEAFIWEENNGMRNLQSVLENDYGLNLMGWILTGAMGISNDSLTICGTGNNGGWVAVLAEPSDPVLLTINVVPNDIGIDSVTPTIGLHTYSSMWPVSLRADHFVRCPYVYIFDHWEGDITDPYSTNTVTIMNTDKTVTAVFVDGAVCGDECHPNFLLGDHNHDCHVDFIDFVMFTSRWMTCTAPECD